MAGTSLKVWRPRRLTGTGPSWILMVRTHCVPLRDIHQSYWTSLPVSADVVVGRTMGYHLHTAPCLSNLDRTVALLMPDIQSPVPACQAINHFKIFLYVFRKYSDMLNMTAAFTQLQSSKQPGSKVNSQYVEGTVCRGCWVG